MVGRTVTIPAKVSKAFSSNLIGTVTVYCLNADKLAGWNAQLGAGEKRFIKAKYLGLPVLGGWSGSPKTMNLETLLANKPDVIFASPAQKSQIEASEKIQADTGIPVLMIDQNLARIDAMIAFVADVLGEPKRGVELATYAKKTMADNAAFVAKIPQSERRRIYYAEGADGLSTDPPGSFHTEVFDVAGAINVARVPELSQQGIIGLSAVSFEQVALWKPDLIFVSDNSLADSGNSFYKRMSADPLWSSLEAVKNGKTYRIPTEPWDWFDRPPSINRLIGVMWAESVLYPGKIGFDIVAEVKKFYALFYGVTLSDADVASILKGEAAR